LNLGAYILRRSLLVVLVVLGTVTITFFLSHLVPGNPAVLFAGTQATPQEVALWTQRLGLDKPLPVQFEIYLRNMLSGNFGDSWSNSNDPIAPLIGQSLPNTFTLAAISTTVAALIGIPLGVEAAKRRGGKFDSLLRIFSVTFVAIPQFWLALLLQLFFNVDLHLLPLASYGGALLYIQHNPIKTVTNSYLIDAALTGNVSGFIHVAWSLLLPVTALSLYPIGVIVRQTRNLMMGIMSENYIRTAKAYGLKEGEINYRYALRNAAGPLAVILALIFAGSIIGVVFVEDVFALYPGIGHLIEQATGTGITSSAIGAVDYPLVLSLTVVITIIYSVSNFVADLVQIYFDRRIIR